MSRFERTIAVQDALQVVSGNMTQRERLNRSAKIG